MNSYKYGIAFNDIEHFVTNVCGGELNLHHLTVREVHTKYILPIIQASGVSYVEYIMNKYHKHLHQKQAKEISKLPGLSERQSHSFSNIYANPSEKVGDQKILKNILVNYSWKIYFLDLYSTLKEYLNEVQSFKHKKSSPDGINDHDDELFWLDIFCISYSLTQTPLIIPPVPTKTKKASISLSKHSKRPNPRDKLRQDEQQVAQLENINKILHDDIGIPEKLINADESQRLSYLWSRMIQYQCRRCDRTIFILSPWDKGDIFAHIQTIFMFYWSCIQEHRMDILIPPNDMDKVMNMASSDPDILKKLWAMPNSVDECEYSNPTYGAYFIRDYLLQISSFKKVKKAVNSKINEYIGSLRPAKKANGRRDSIALNPDILNIQTRYSAALTLIVEGKKKEAFAVCSEVLQACNILLGPTHPETLYIRRQLGTISMQMHNWSQAKKILEELFNIYFANFGESHADTLATMSLIGECYSKTGDFDVAEEKFQACYDFQCEHVGVQHPQTLQTMYRFGLLYYELGKYSNSEQLLLKCLENQKVLFGLDHNETIMTMLKLAFVYNIQRKFSLAENMFQEYIKYAVPLLGREDDGVQKAFLNLANLYLIQWKYDLAEEMFQEIYEYYRTSMGETHPATLDAGTSLAKAFLQTEKYSQAEKLSLEILQRGVQLYGNDSHPTVKQYLVNYQTAVLEHTEWENNQDKQSASNGNISRSRSGDSNDGNSARSSNSIISGGSHTRSNVPSNKQNNVLPVESTHIVDSIEGQCKCLWFSRQIRPQPVNHLIVRDFDRNSKTLTVTTTSQHSICVIS